MITINIYKCELIYTVKVTLKEGDKMIVFDTTPKDKKTCNIIIRVTEQEKQRLHLAAMELDMSVTQLLKIAVENYLQEEL